MSDLCSRLDLGSGEPKAIQGSPRILITGACRGAGLACAELFAARGARLILCDKDAARLEMMSKAMDAASFPCDVASEASIKYLAAAVCGQFASLDMVVNAAGGGYERSLGMYRVSRALLPALGRGTIKTLVNVAPTAKEAEASIFPYASSRMAFDRLSSALALEARPMEVSVMIGCSATRQLVQVAPDPDAGTSAASCNTGQPVDEDMKWLAWQVALLIARRSAPRRQSERRSLPVVGALPNAISPFR